MDFARIMVGTVVGTTLMCLFGFMLYELLSPGIRGGREKNDGKYAVFIELPTKQQFYRISPWFKETQKKKQ